MTQLSLLDLIEKPPAPPKLTHILMPCMAWACGGDIVTKPGHIAFGSRNPAVDCPDCLALDPDEVYAESRRQQGHQA